MEGAMLAVYRQDFGSPLPRRVCHQLARRDHNLLVGQPNSFSSLDRSIGRNQPRRAMGSGQNNVNLRMRRGLDLPAHPASNLHGWGSSETSKPLAQWLNTLGISDAHQLWGKVMDLLGQQLQVLSGAKRDRVKSVRQILDDVQTLPPNRTC
jgi:hypothetical protein